MEYNSRLKIENGDIFKLDENVFDSAIVYVAGGFTGINTDFRENFEKLKNSRIAYLIYSDRLNSPISKFYKSRGELFESEDEIINYIDNEVKEALDTALSIGNRIAISGMWIRGIDQVKNEKWMMKSLSSWLDSHQEAKVTLIDKNDNICKHGII